MRILLQRRCSNHSTLITKLSLRLCWPKESCIFNNWQFRGSQLRDLAGANYSTPIRSDLGIIFSNDCALLQIAYVRDKSYDIDIPTVTNLSFTIKLFGF